MLFGLLQIIESDEKESEKHDKAQSEPLVIPEREAEGKSYLVVDGVARCPRKEGQNEQH